MKSIKKEINVINDCRGMFEDEIIDTVLHSRGIRDRTEFLNPSKNNLIPFERLSNIDKAAAIVIEGIRANKTFEVFFDVDLDGCAAGAIMFRYLRNFTDNVRWSINEGKKHGLEDIKDEDYKDIDILIIVDSINNDGKAYSKLKKIGVDTIVLDHHEVTNNELFETITLVSSVIDNYPNPALSGAGVVWKFCSFLDECFDTDYAAHLVDLATCGIIGDMSDVSVRSMENRYICHCGFENLENPAIKLIVGNYEFDSTAVSFSIAPLVNAANRMKQNEYVATLFLMDDLLEINEVVKTLKSLKEKQNEIIDEIMPDILKQINSQINNKVLYLLTNDANSEINGLIGNKLLEIYQRPIFVLSKKIKTDEQGCIKSEDYGGSCRAIGIKDFRLLCASTELCVAQGHPSAFGIFIKKDNFDRFANKISSLLNDIEFVSTIDADMKVNIRDITESLIKKIKNINKISGTGFPAINALIPDIVNYEINSMSKNKHLVIEVKKFQFIKWNYKGDWDYLRDSSMLDSPIDFIGTLDTGFIGRRFSNKLIIENFIIKE